MKILGFEISRTRTAERRSYQDALKNWRQAVNFTSVPTFASASPLTAMGVPAVFLCVDKIDKTIGTLPKVIMDVDDPERPVQVLDTPLAKNIRRRPNGWQNGTAFWRLLSNRKLLWGNFYAEIQRDVRTGEAIGLWPLLSQDVTPDVKAGKKVFRVAGKELADEDIFHVVGHSWNGLQGVSVLTLHRQTIGAAVEMGGFVEGFYRNGAKLSGFVKHPGTIGEGSEAIDRLKRSISDLWQGAENAGKVGVLEEGMEFQPWSMPLGDAEFVETRRFQVAEVARIFDMPLHKLGETAGMKYNNVEQGNIAFVIDCLEPHIQQIVDEANNKLFAERDRGRRELRIPTLELLQGDLESQLKALGMARQWGLMTINEARRRLGLPSAGPDGDKLFIPGNANTSMTKDSGAGADPPPPATPTEN